MLLKCKACGAALDADRVDFTHGIATCRFCKAVMAFEELKAEPPDGSEDRPSAERPPVPLPAKFRVDDSFGELRIRWRWFTPAIVFLAFFCIGWDSFLVFWYTTAFSEGAPWIMFVFPVAHLAVGVGLTYLTLAVLLNSSTVTVSDGRLTVRHGPLPWPGNLEADASEIEQVYCQEKVRSGKNGPSRSYEVHAVTRSNAKRKLLDTLTDADQALFIEQRIEEFLRLKDRPVGGELPRT